MRSWKEKRESGDSKCHGRQMKREVNNIKSGGRTEITTCQEIQFIHSFNTYIKITYCVSSIAVDTGDSSE